MPTELQLIQRVVFQPRPDPRFNDIRQDYAEWARSYGVDSEESTLLQVGFLIRHLGLAGIIAATGDKLVTPGRRGGNADTGTSFASWHPSRLSILADILAEGGAEMLKRMLDDHGKHDRNSVILRAHPGHVVKKVTGALTWRESVKAIAAEAAVAAAAALEEAKVAQARKAEAARWARQNALDEQLEILARPVDYRSW